MGGIVDRGFSRRAALSALGGLVCAACAAPVVPQPLPPGPSRAAPPPPVPPPYADQLAALGIGWVPPRQGKAVLVNIPSFDVIAFADGAPVLVSRAIVGAPPTPTPVGNRVSGVIRFRPTWRPTPRMVRAGLYADYVRRPGPDNPLGLAAIRFDDGGEIYLHGTNRPHLFAQDHRALSAGCVRVERIEELVAFVLDWSIADVQAAMAGERTFDAPTAGVPIRLGYHTTFLSPGADPRRHEDIYRLG